MFCATPNTKSRPGQSLGAGQTARLFGAHNLRNMVVIVIIIVVAVVVVLVAVRYISIKKKHTHTRTHRLAHINHNRKGNNEMSLCADYLNITGSNVQLTGMRF